MPGVLCVSGLGDDTSRAQGGQQAVVGLDKGLQAGTRGDVCHCGTGGQSSSGAGRTSGTGRTSRTGRTSGAGGTSRTGRTSSAGRTGRPGSTRGAGNGADSDGLAGGRAGGTGTIGIQRLGGNGAACAAEAFLMIHKHNLHSQDMRRPDLRCRKQISEWGIKKGLNHNTGSCAGGKKRLK